MKRPWPAQKTLFDLGPAQDVVVESARALALSGDRPHARQLLVGVAHDQACPPSIRADAYYLRDYELKGIGVVVSRTRYTTEIGFEIYCRDASRNAETLREIVLEAGKPHGLAVIGFVLQASELRCRALAEVRHERGTAT